MTMLPALTRVMNVGYLTGQAFVTDSRPFCDYWCQFVYGQKNVWSTNSRHM